MSLDEWYVRFTQGDEEAAAVLYRALFGPLSRKARRIGAREQDIEDLIQDTWEQIWKKRWQYRGPGSLVGFATTILRNIAISKWRRRETAQRAIEETKSVQLADEGYEHLDPTVLHLTSMKAAWDRLTEVERAAIRDWEVRPARRSGRRPNEVRRFVELFHEEREARVGAEEASGD